MSVQPEIRPVTILVVDDSSTVRQKVRQALADTDYEVLEAADGQEGLEAIRARPDMSLVLCDVNMPRMDGLQLLEQVRASELTVPIVMLTTEGQPELVKRAREAGALGWMVKPVASAHLIQVITKLSRTSS